MHLIKFRDRLIELDRPLVSALWRECQPKILVVTDQLSYTASADFGLTQFVGTLASSQIHGMTPQVIKAARGGSLANADINNFQFNHPDHGVLKSRYDVVFIFGFTSEGVNQLPQLEIDALARFMQAGGGVFATGDHESLGASISKDIPRVRSMRKWRQADTPHVSNQNRLSTNLSGTNETEDFVDQSDRFAQRLYLNFRTEAGGLGNPHPLAQMVPPLRALEVFPDHPHEGECVIPSNLTTRFSLDGSNVDEWPALASGARVSPEAVAFAMSHGDGFAVGPTGPKDPLQPRSFMAVCAYDGQRANVGRVVTDATWHHFVNVNLDGATSGLLGLRVPGANPGDPPIETQELARIRQYYRNLATWLMPKNVRRCLRIPRLVIELQRFPLFEELDLRRPPEWRAAHLRDIGLAVADSLSRRLPKFEVQAMVADALDDALGDRASQLAGLSDRIGQQAVQDLGLAALGGVTAGLVAALEEVGDVKEIQPHGTIERHAVDGARAAVKLLMKDHRRDLQATERALHSLEN